MCCRLGNILSAVLIACVCVDDVTASLEKRRLHEYLVANYSRHVPPVLDVNTPINITIEMELTRIIGLDERNQQLKSSGFFVARWVDEYLRWNPAEYHGIESLVIPPNQIWLPDFGLKNSVKSFYQDTFHNDFRVRVWSNGTTQWSFGGQFETQCPLDTTLYPFDKQKCELKLENWAYTGLEVALYNGSDHIELDAYKPNGLWDIFKTEVVKEDHYYQATMNTPFPEVEFKIYIKRKSYFYMMNLVLPCFFMILVALGVFWVPPSSGEKVSLSITVLLAFSVFQLVLQEQTAPNSDYSPLIGRLVTSVMAMSSVSVLTAIVVLYFHFRDCHHPVPYVLKVIAFKFMARLLCFSSLPHITSKEAKPESKNERDEPSMTVTDLENQENRDHDRKTKSALADMGKSEEWAQLALLSADVRYMTHRICEKEEQADLMAEWSALAKVLDRTMFYVTIIVLIVTSSMFLQYYEP